jgi:hypothetical protein
VTNEEQDAGSRWSRLRTRYLPVLVITLVVGVVGSLFVFSYSSALGNPTPRNVPIGLVTTGSGAAGSVPGALPKAAGTTFKVTDYPTRAAARDAIDHQKIYGALVFDSSTTATLYTSAASSNAVATLLTSAEPSLKTDLGLATITTVDTHPLHPRDPQGTVLFYIALATIILGFVGAIQVRVNTKDLGILEDILADVGRVIVVSLFLSLTIVVIARFETSPFFRLWGVLSLAMMVSSMSVNVFRLLVGPKWGLLPTWILFVVVANPSSGGAVAPQLLPPLYEAVGRFLPTGAAVQAIRDITYFPGAIHGEPFVILLLWLVVTTAAMIGLRLRKQRRAELAALRHRLETA